MFNPFKRLMNILLKAREAEEDPRNKAHLTKEERQEGRILQRKIRKQALLTKSRKDGYESKRKKIEDGKGRNGKSMNPALLARHGIS